MNFKIWTKVSLINFFIVSLLGLLMRYKIAFDFPYFDQKFLQHAHSHFAFIAWISQSLYLLLIYYLHKTQSSINFTKYNRLLIINTIASYCMMIAFMFKGYHYSSIFFTNILIIISIIFSYSFYKESNRNKLYKNINRWFYVAFLFNILSNIGTFSLAYMMITGVYNQKLQLSSIYFYLHFQYNAWFLFVCIGMFLFHFKDQVNLKIQNWLFYIFTFCTIPNYFLSILFYKLPNFLFIIVIITSVAQLLMYLLLFRKFKTQKIPSYYYLIFKLIALAFLFKLILQVSSTIPYISHLAYSLRSIVIAYLHLALLVIISGFIIYLLFDLVLKHKSIYVYILYSLILINELLLGIQGFSGIFYIHIKSLGIILFIVSAIISIVILKIIFEKKSNMIEVIN